MNKTAFDSKFSYYEYTNLRIKMVSPEHAWPFPTGNRQKTFTRSVVARITSIEIKDLFGLYNYNIPSNLHDIGRTPILYGENGLGKTNILKIIYHTLSAAHNKGHRTTLGKIKFLLVKISLSNGITVSAQRRAENLLGAMRLEIRSETQSKNRLLGAWDWHPEGDPTREASHKWLASLDPEEIRKLNLKSSSKERARAIQSLFFTAIEKESNPLESEDAFLTALQNHVPPIYFMTADRILMSDEVPKEGQRYVAADVNASRGLTAELMVTKGRERALNEAIAMTSLTLSQLAVSATRQGSRSMHSIYEELIASLTSKQILNHSTAQHSLAALKSRLIDLSGRYALFENYGLAPQFKGSQLVSLLDKAQNHNSEAVADVLAPYVESLTEQANSLMYAYDAIHKLVSTVNGFLYDKTLSFALGDGMIVRNRLGDPLEPSDLSSGEQQLLLLFCHIAMAHNSGGIFIVDEPEISLNIKWQRRLVDALTKLDPNENLQFFLASHSMEVLSKHRESVISLEHSRK